MKSGFAHGNMDVGATSPIIEFAGNRVVNTKILLNLFPSEDQNPVPTFVVENPEEKGAPFQISAVFCDFQMKEVFRIHRNELIGFSGTWDIEATGGRIIVHTNEKIKALELLMKPPHGVQILSMDMVFGKARVLLQDNSLHFISAAQHVSFTDLEFVDFDINFIVTYCNLGAYLIHGDKWPLRLDGKKYGTIRPLSSNSVIRLYHPSPNGILQGSELNTRHRIIQREILIDVPVEPFCPTIFPIRE